MSLRYLGGVISATAPTVAGPSQTGAASGVWSRPAQMQYAGAGVWPTQGIVLKQLWSWGRNTQGGLGLGNTTNFSSPNQVGTLTGWENVSNNGEPGSTLSIKTDGTLWSWGNNDYGQLGLGTTVAVSSPKQVGSLTNWLVASCGGLSSSQAIKTDGTLWCWGNNDYGQSGLGNVTRYSSPKQVGALTNWLSITSGYLFSIAIKTNGTLWSFGRNNVGQLGLGDVVNRSSPVQVGVLNTWAYVDSGANYTLALKTNGTLWSWGQGDSGQLGLGGMSNYSSPKQVGLLTNWRSVSSGYVQSLATKTDGALWAWGSGSLGGTFSPAQVGSLTNWSIITSGWFFAAATKTDGTLWSWGANQFGQLGLGDIVTRSSPVQVGSLTSWIKLSAGPYSFVALKTP